MKMVTEKIQIFFTETVSNRTVLIALLLLFFSIRCFGQTNLGNELTEMKIEVRQSKAVLAENASKSNSDFQIKAKTLPISRVPILEEGESLIIKFCADCKGRRFEDLGFRKIIVFFVNPASIYADFSNNFEKAFREIEFETGPKISKKKREFLYREHEFKVPYRSIPLIFLVSRGEYRDDIKKVILEKQADVIRLGEQSNMLIELPQAVRYLLQVREVLNTPAAYNTRVAQSLLQRAQFFRLDRTNCFSQSLYRDERDKLECLVKNFNVAEFEKDLNSLNFDKYGKLVGQEVVAQLRNKYDGLNVFLDATVAVIELVGALFRKKPLNIQIGALAQSRNDYLSLRQMPINLQANTERALLIAPLKWREKEEIVTKKMLGAVEVLPDRQCLTAGKNLFWLETGNPLVKKEINRVTLELESIGEAKDVMDTVRKHSFGEILVSPADGSIPLIIDETAWRKIKNWRDVKGKAIFEYNFETIEKDFDLKILPITNWQIIRQPGETIRRGADSVLKITPNTTKRDCLDKIVIIDAKKQELQLTPFQGFTIAKSGIIELNLSAQNKEKLQPGKLSISFYENGNELPANKITAELLEKKPQFSVTAFRGDKFATIKGERLGEIKRITLNGKETEFDAETKRINLADVIMENRIKFDIQLTAGDSIIQTVETLPSRPQIAGKISCQNIENQSYLSVSRKPVYQPYELAECVYPADSDEIKFVLVADQDYAFSLVNKPLITIAFAKDENSPVNSVNEGKSVATNSNTNAATTSNVTVPAQVVSPKRLDATLKIDQKTKEHLEDGKHLFLKISDPVRGESDWYPVNARFLRLPSDLRLNCASIAATKSAENKDAVSGATNPAGATKLPSPAPSNCELSGSLGMLESVFILTEEGQEKEFPVSITSEKLTLSKLPAEKNFYIKLRGYAPEIKVNFDANAQTQLSNPIEKPTLAKPSN